MVDGAPAPARPLRRLAALLEGRALVAHNASFDRRALRQGFARAGLRWPDPPVLCTLSLARRFAPLAHERKLAALAASLGIEVCESHRALPDAETCGRVFCALFPRLCAHAPTLAEAVALLSPRRRPRAAPRREPARAGSPAERPDVAALPREPGVYVFRDDRGRPLYVGKSVSVRARARAHLSESAPARWAEAAHLVEHRPTESELGALVLENRLIKALRPPGNVALKRVDGLVFLCSRLDIEYPILEVLPAPPAGRAVAVGPLRGRAAARELIEQLSSIFGLRHCGRRLRRRRHPSAYGQMGRCLSPCLGDLDPNLYRRRLDAALELFTASEDGGALLLAHIEEDMRAAAARRRYERAAALRRRHARLSVLLERLGGVLRAVHALPRLVLAPHPSAARWDALWLVEGRVVDWGALPGLEELARRTRAAVAQPPLPGPGTVLAPEEVDEVRIVAAWLARHPETPALALDPLPGPRGAGGVRRPGARVSWAVRRSGRSACAGARASRRWPARRQGRPRGPGRRADPRTSDPGGRASRRRSWRRPTVADAWRARAAFRERKASLATPECGMDTAETTRAQRRAAARDERRARERAALARARRTRRARLLAVTLGVAAALVVALVFVERIGSRRHGRAPGRPPRPRRRRHERPLRGDPPVGRHAGGPRGRP